MPTNYPALFFFLTATLSAQPALTIYNGNFGVVRDNILLDLKAGLNEQSYSGVTTQLEPESVILRDPTGQVDLRVIEQSYRGDPVDQDRLLKMFEGETIRFLKIVDRREIIQSGKIIRAPSLIMSTNSRGGRQQTRLDPIIELEGELITHLPGTPLFPSLGDGSILKPTLSWKLHSNKDARLEAQLSYLTQGMTWKSDYNLVLPEAGDAVTLTGWVSIQNNTGTSFQDAAIKLIAGDVNQVADLTHPFGGDAAVMRTAAAPEIETKKFDEFHMYSLPLRTTLRDQETKQIEFVRAEDVKTTRHFVYNGAGNLRYRGGLQLNQNFGLYSQADVAIFREFKNSRENALGIALPAGKIRFYRKDSDGQIEFTGENTIDHTPDNESVRVYLGNAFDIVGERKRTNFYTHPSRSLIRESFEIEIRNRSEEAVTVQIVEPLYRSANWTIQQNSSRFNKLDSQSVEFPIEVAPREIKRVGYTVEYTW